MKKTLAAILTAVCFFSSFGAFAQSSETSDAPKVQKMTIDDAVLYAIENSPSVKSAQANVDKNTSLVKEVKANQRYVSEKYKNSEYFPLYVTDAQNLLNIGYTLDAQNTALAIAQRTLEDTKFSVETNVNQNFYTYLSKKQKIEIAEESLKNANKRLDQAREQKNQGLISDFYLKSFELSVLNSEMNLNKAIRDCDYALMNLKASMGYPLSDDLEIIGEFKRAPIVDTPLSTAMDNLKTSNSVLNAEDNMKLTEELTEIYKKWYASNTYSYEKAIADYNNAKANYEAQLSSARLLVVSSYNAMHDAYEQLEVLDKNIELSKKNIEILSAKYDMGMIGALDLVEKIQEFDSLQNQLIDAELAAMLAGRAYKATFSDLD
ncbi:MAG: TolC family protein [Clostridia bacterium]|nr:TolC family protein [Clostridia bacterium]